MLSSIHPLGERAKGHRFWRGLTAFVIGSILGGCLLGAAGAVASGAIRAVVAWGDRGVPGREWVLGGVWALVVVCLAAAAADATGLNRFMRGWHRQVDEGWLTTYRDWVYGFGYGLQLGVGVVTIVTSASVWALLAALVVVPHAWVAVVVGASFGLARGVSLLPAARVTDPGRLTSLHAMMDRLDQPARWVTVGVLTTVAVVVAWAIAVPGVGGG